jgi:di/tricarboxylate transporter
MQWQGTFTLGLIFAMLLGLIWYSHLADVIFLGGVVILALVGILTPAEALAGFSNAGMLTVAALFVVATGLRDTGALDRFAHRLLGRPQGEKRALLRLLTPIAASSAVLNNTTIVAMALPVVVDWCRRNRMAASRFLIPLSYATIAGGMCTLIGTSTNLVVHGLMLEGGGRGFGFLELGFVGVPVTIVTLLYLLFVTPRFLPHRQEFLEQLGATRREYIVEMSVEPICPFIGQSVQAAGLRHLPGLFLVEIGRGGELISPVAPDEPLRAGDRLIFAGVVSTIVDLQRIKGLVPVTPDEQSASFHLSDGDLCEAVVSASSPLVGRSIRDANFRTVYDAAVIAVHRNGARLSGKIGDIGLRPGDALLLRTSAGFVRAHRNNPDFYLVSEVGGYQRPRHHKVGIATGILLLLIAAMAAPDVMEWLGVKGEWFHRFQRGQVLFALAAAGLMVVSRCVPAASARRSIQWDVLFVIAASFGISKALEKTGASEWLVTSVLPVFSQWGPLAALAAVYLLCNILTELLTNNAAAALVFPIAMTTALKMGLDPKPFAVAVAAAASGGFATPIGYQTHLMVFGPGGYKYGDFVRAGLPLNIVWFIVSMIVIPLVWPLRP